MRERRASCLVATLVLVGLASVAGVTGGCRGAPAGPVAAGRPEAPGGFPDTPSFVAGTRLHLRDGEHTLTIPGAAPPHGWLVPVAVPSPDGRQVIYRTWVDRPDGSGHPALRRYDTVTGDDEVLVDGAASLAWGAGGRFAFAEGGDLRPNAVWTGRIKVRSSITSAVTTQWSSRPGRYVVAAWAADRLLAYELDEVGRPVVVIFDGPGRSRPLGPGALVAVSPDGGRAFLAETGDTDTPQVRIVELASGETAARLDLRGTGIAGIGHAGDWAGDRVVAAGIPDTVVFSVAGGAIRMLVKLRHDHARHPYGIREPALAGDTVIGWAANDTGQDPATTMLRCRIGTGVCTAGPVYPPPGVHPVTNPSRPLP
jgi:hypothetical protein